MSTTRRTRRTPPPAAGKASTSRAGHAWTTPPYPTPGPVRSATPTGGYLETRDAPTPRLTVTAQPSPHGALITADATATTTWLPLTITTYNFSFGDGTGVTQSTPTARHTYTTFGTYPVTVEVRDSSGTTARITTTTWTYLPIPRVPTSVSSSRRPPVRR